MIRVLLADDNVAVRSALHDLLESDSQISVVAVCADGHEAREHLVRTDADIAVLDVRMPLGGAELVRAARERGLEVICLSADVCAETDMLAAGASEFLVKGERSSDICAAVKRAAASLKNAPSPG